ncbi:MAG: hypothetical protein MJ169_03450 [Treponema sp.]|nr:hypothetical protein [Treponema sp.]
MSEQIFTFNSFVYLPTATIKKVLAKTDSAMLVKACCGCDAKVIDAFCNSMSGRAAAIFREDIEFMGPVLLDDVCSARVEVIKILNSVIKKDSLEVKAADGTSLILKLGLCQDFFAALSKEIFSGLKKKDRDYFLTYSLTKDCGGKLVYCMEELLNISDRDMQKGLRETDEADIAKALVKVSDKVQKKFYQNMSKKAAAGLKEKVTANSKLKKTEVEAAQNKVLSIYNKLITKGEIVPKFFICN